MAINNLFRHILVEKVEIAEMMHRLVKYHP